MKQIGVFVVAILLMASPLFPQNVTIPDNAFLNSLIDAGVDANRDFTISYVEAKDVHILDLRSKGISNMKGLEAFVELWALDLDNNPLTSLDISHNALLFELIITNMPGLIEVCGWDSTHSGSPFGVNNINIDGSPNICFTNDCGSCLTGIEERNQSGLSVYPNPTNDLLTIETDQPGQHTIEITSLSGQVLISTKMEGQTFQLDLSSFQKGVYFITVRSRDQLWTEKIIKL